MNRAVVRELVLRNLATMPPPHKFLNSFFRWRPDLSPADPDAPKKPLTPGQQRFANIAAFTMIGITAIFIIWSNVTY